MVKWKIDTLTPQEIAKYRQRSSNAINGIEYLLKYAISFISRMGIHLVITLLHFLMLNTILFHMMLML